jgi:hypothetical protein
MAHPRFNQPTPLKAFLNLELLFTAYTHLSATESVVLCQRGECHHMLNLFDYRMKSLYASLPRGYF